MGMKKFGIDLGTSYSAISYVERPLSPQEDPTPVQFSNSAVKMPSAVYIPEGGEPYVGFDAIVQKVVNPARFYDNFKRHLDPDHPQLRALPDGQAVDAINLQRQVLLKLLSEANQRVGEEVINPVICHPAGGAWHSYLKTVCAGLDIEPDFISEPEAALYYAQHKHRFFNEKEKNVLLIDFGGGTCDFILMKVSFGLENGILRQRNAIAFDEDRLDLGGNDIDRLIRDEFIRKWKERYPEEQHPILYKSLERFDAPEIDQELFQTAKLVKETLSQKYRDGEMKFEFPIRLNGLPNSTKLEYKMPVQHLYDLTFDFLRQKIEWMLLEDIEEGPQKHRKFLGRKGIKPEDITLVLLTGGSNQLPWIQHKIIADIFPYLYAQKRILLLSSPEMSVSFGAALYAYDRDEDNIKFTRTLQEDLRIKIEGRDDAYELVKRGAVLPYPSKRLYIKAKHFFPFPATGKQLLIELLAGNDHRASKCRQLSYEPREIEFQAEISAGSPMQMRVEIDLKGDIHLYFSQVKFSLRKPEEIMISFGALNVKSVLEEGKK